MKGHSQITAIDEKVVYVATALLASAIVIGATSCTKDNRPQLRKVHTEHLGQLTRTTLNPTGDVGITGTDLGVSFVEAGTTRRLIFLFGDSWTLNGKERNKDSAAWTLPSPIPDRNRMPRLTWFTNQVTIQNVTLGGDKTPVEGLGFDGRNYIFAIADCGGFTCSALAHTDESLPGNEELTLDWTATTDKFLNVSAFLEGDIVWIFGSGGDRNSNIYLAKVSRSQFPHRSSWEYYQGGGPDNARFGPNEDASPPIVSPNCVGELSVRKHSQLGYLMLYNCLNELPPGRGIHLRRASNPWGPWDDPINIFNPDFDRGYGYFMHREFQQTNYDDGLAEPGLHPEIPGEKICPENGWRLRCTGGEYGPYLVPEWFTITQDGGYSIVYTLSTWVPYQVHLMRTILARADDPEPKPPPRPGRNVETKLTNGDFHDNGFCNLAGWQTSGDMFAVFTRQDGTCRLTTFTPAKGDNAKGRLFQDFVVNDTTEAIRFWVHGGDATVTLQRGPDIVRESRGRSSRPPHISPETQVCWNLSEYAGDTLTLAVVDDKTGPWGFIGVSGFQLLGKPCGQ